MNNLKKKKLRMYFVPYLIYDNIIDIFSYNKKSLLDCPQTAIDLKTWNYNGIINKRSNLDYIDAGGIITNFELQEIELNRIL